MYLSRNYSHQLCIRHAVKGTSYVFVMQLQASVMYLSFSSRRQLCICHVVAGASYVFVM